MHSAFTRANVVVFFSLTTLLVAGLGCALSYWTHTLPAARNLSGSIGHVRFRTPQPFWGSIPGHEYLSVEFDLAADLRPLWSWNCKQLYTQVVASWRTESGPQSAAVWKRVINGTEPLERSNLRLRVERGMTQEWGSPRDLPGKVSPEALLLAGEQDSLHAIARAEREEERYITLQLQVEVFPIIGATLITDVNNATTRFQIPSTQKLFVRPITLQNYDD